MRPAKPLPSLESQLPDHVLYPDPDKGPYVLSEREAKVLSKLLKPRVEEMIETLGVILDPQSR